MPAGVSWGEYLKFFTCAMLSMMAGSQLVHTYYKPLEDLRSYIEKEEQAFEMEHSKLPNTNDASQKATTS